MGKITGFMDFNRQAPTYRDTALRLLDYQEIYSPNSADTLVEQGARCMDCGVPFCQSDFGCPVYNLIPEWNDLVYHGQWHEALQRLHKTNNFPEFTGRVCPAPCEGACILGITEQPVTIKNIEKEIIEHGFKKGWVQPQPPLKRSGKTVSIIGSGPTGLAAAAQINKMGHWVRVYDRADNPGGLLMYGIPNMKLDKDIVFRRLQILADEGISFITGKTVGNGQNNSLDINTILHESDALLLSTGATIPRDLKIPGRQLKGIHFAMDFLSANTRRLLSNDNLSFISAKDKNVIVIGGGDTGTDCIATALRHQCATLTNFEIMSKPPQERSTNNPWPNWPHIYRVDYGHEESISISGKDPREYLISGKEFIGDSNGQLKVLITNRVTWKNGRPEIVANSEQEWPADLIFLAMGFLGPDKDLSTLLDIDLDSRTNYQTANAGYNTKRAKVFAAGDCRSGQSLVVRAINEGRQAAQEINDYLNNLSGKTP